MAGKSLSQDRPIGHRLAVRSANTDPTTDSSVRSSKDQERFALFLIRNTHLRFAAVMLIGLALAACSARGTGVIFAPAAAVGTSVPVIVVTSRAVSAPPDHFSSRRSAVLSFARFEVSVPPDRRPGTVRFPVKSSPEPQTDFLIASSEQLDGPAGFVDAVNGELAARRRTTATVFVHGYNTNFAEGLFRQAQLHADYADPGISVNYSWPSAAAARFYVYDIESAIFARTGLEATINGLTGSHITGMTLVAHSMGGQVLMETLNQMAVRGDSSAFRKIKDVVLLSPDVNVDLFGAQLRAIARYNLPIYIVVSGKDEALQISSRLRGERARLGALRQNPWEAAGYNVKLIDLTDVRGGDPLRHFSAGSSPSVIALVKGLNETGVQILNDSDGNSGFFSDSLDILDQGTSQILHPFGGL
jgi:esterase/lipase superfamily enzyme